MTFDEIKFWSVLAFQVVNLFASAVVFIYLRYGDRNRQIDERFESMASANDKRADGFERRLAHIEGQLERAPTHSDLAAIHEKLNLTNASVSQMSGQLGGINDMLKLILNRIAEKGMP
ncbi:MAG: hypothetical protein KDH15_21640 [Rhodocyclaceae bacterium]|nr:hypothetical protein [Rhodocyclaceae bacterium]